MQIAAPFKTIGITIRYQERSGIDLLLYVVPIKHKYLSDGSDKVVTYRTSDFLDSFDMGTLIVTMTLRMFTPTFSLSTMVLTEKSATGIQDRQVQVTQMMTTHFSSSLLTVLTSSSCFQSAIITSIIGST